MPGHEADWRLNPFLLANELEETYRSYLLTTFQFREPELRASFESAMAKGTLRKGPFLEMAHSYVKDETIGSLLGNLGLRAGPGFLEALGNNRPLYRHQTSAIRKLIDGRNVVVATGTGSGKTESFLYPILIHLLQEQAAGGLTPGVRALVLYPMNALANDQRERLGAICSQLLTELPISFGQFTGETPENARDRRRDGPARARARLPGELVFREEMRATPPHILLTNYSMLEYLLIRPDDSPLFDGDSAQSWRFLVIDEAHQYRGSKGVEMAMLLRRLKRRLRESGQRLPFRCVATSASLGGDGSVGAVAEFAQALFDEPFEAPDVINAVVDDSPFTGDEEVPSSYYSDSLRDLAAGNSDELIPTVLLQDRRARVLTSSLKREACDIRDLAPRCFPELTPEVAASCFRDLVSLLSLTMHPETGDPLLRVRYHLFLRALEGAFVRLVPTPEVFLDRQGATAEGATFEVALCKECGQHYFLGPHDFDRGVLSEPIRDPGDTRFGVTYFRPVEDAPVAADVFSLCLRCGLLGQTTSCDHADRIQVVRETSTKVDAPDQISSCGLCGHTAGGKDPVREVVYGADGPQAVIATTVLKNLPESRRRLLAFADGRQEAAFFAWYFETSYRDLLWRNQIWHCLIESQETELSLSEFAALLAARARNGLLPASMGQLEIRRECHKAVLRELLTDEPRISLRGVTLLDWRLLLPPDLQLADLQTSFPFLSGLDGRKLADLLIEVLGTLRLDRAVDLDLDGRTQLAWSDLEITAQHSMVRIGEPRGQKDVRSWDGPSGRRADFVTRVFSRMAIQQPEHQALEFLRSLWELVLRRDLQTADPVSRMLLSAGDGRRLNPRWIRASAVLSEERVYRCDLCRRVESRSILGVCPRRKCRGTLREVDAVALPGNHYRDLYTSSLPPRLRAEEHTAQLSNESARAYQREFRDGSINLLSSSTTFELGVDLGELDTVLLRNVPPEAFNYTQRVGRVGRRSGTPGFAVTFCRRSPHDLYHFQRPDSLLSGNTRPPVVAISNPKIVERHITAVVLSAFFRARANADRFGTTKDFVGDLSEPAASRDLRSFIRESSASLRETLETLVPAEVHVALGLPEQWIERMAGDDSRLRLAELELRHDYTNLRTLESHSAGSGDYRTAAWASARQRTMEGEDILSFLSRKAIIPKYGFPVDVVELDVSAAEGGADSVQLQRDLSLAVAEFAPESRLIANKKLWTSYGLKRVPEREWRRVRYFRCMRHGVFVTWLPGEPTPPSPCGDSLAPFTYVIPQFGFVTDRTPPKLPSGRPAKLYSTKPYFVGLQTPRPEPLPSVNPIAGMTITESSPGTMAVVCEGRKSSGFYVCDTCGAGSVKRQRKHRTPFGRTCTGMSSLVSLGHEFQTDVVEARFEAPPPAGADTTAFSYALAYALSDAAAQALEVPTTDLSATLRYGPTGRVQPIILYDNVPGGAGLVARLRERERVEELLRNALARVDGRCGCGDETSCYGCLRSYRNQFVHDVLKRGPVHAYLSALISPDQDS